MRSRRLLFLFLAFYFVFLGGSAYYNLFFPVRFFHHAFVTILLAGWFIHKLRQDGLPRTPLNRPIYAAVIVWGVTSAFSIDPRMAFEHLWFVLLHVIIFFFLVDLFQRGRQRLVMETQFLLAAVVVIITGIEVLSWLFGLGITPGTDIGWLAVMDDVPLSLPRVSLAMNISTLLAGYTAPLIVLTIGWALTARRRDYRRALWLLVAGLAVTLLLTFSRGGLLSVATGLGAFAAMRITQQPVVLRRVSPVLLAGGAAVGAILLVVLLSLSQARLSGDAVRLDLYRSAIEITRDHPVTGVGVGMYGRAYRDYRTISILTRDRLASAHNAYLNTAAESGLLGVTIGLWAGVVLLGAWWRAWQAQKTTARKIRLEVTIAALLGIGVHSMVDVFTTTPVVSVIVLLLAYSLTGHRRPWDERPRGVRWVTAVGLLITLAYGGFFFQVDRAQSQYQRSFDAEDDALTLAREAKRLDPYLHLYDLHIAYLLGEAALDDTTTFEEAIAAYQHALTLEPTWQTGWINLAALERERGNREAAITYLETAQTINPLYEPAWIYLAEMAETVGNRATKSITRDYRSGMHWNIQVNNRLPLSDYWTETYRRIYALKEYMIAPLVTVEWEYRIFSVIDPDRAAWFVPETPETAPEHWVAGEHALTVLNDAETAAQHFSAAIALEPAHGDYYVSRARATVQTDPQAAQHDLDIAQWLGTQFEQPNTVRAWLSSDPDQINDLLSRALPPRTVPQEFAAVLYARPAIFDVYLPLRAPGPGHAAMQPWYLLAENYRRDGDTDRACRVYAAIVDYAPDESAARQQLEACATS